MNRPLLQRLKRLSQVAPALLSLLLFGVAIWAIQQALHQYRLEAVIQSVRAISGSRLLAAFALMLLDYAVMTGYDALAVRYIRRTLPYRRTALAAIISTVISNNVGFTLLANSAMRYRFYSAWGLSAIEIASIAAFCNLSYGLGQLAVGGVVFLVEPLSIPTALHLPFTSVHPLGAICLALALVYLLSSAFSRRSIALWRWRIPHLPLNISLAQVAIASLDWMLAAAILYVLLPASLPLSYPAYLGIYLLAQFAGVVSNVPGGLGIFETVMLLLLAPWVAAGPLFGSLLAYRGIYYFLPLVVSVGAFGLYELRRYRTQS